MRKRLPEAIQLFRAPPSVEELEKQIRGRGTEAEEAIQRALKRAQDELADKTEFDAVIVNDDLETALAELENKMNLTGT